INGVPMPLAALREVGESLVDIHGQHEHLALGRAETQRDLLDGYAGATKLAEQVARAAGAVQDAHQALEAHRSALSGRTARLEFLQFQARELDELGPREDEYDALNEEFELLRHRERGTEAVAGALNALEDEEPSALGQLASAREALARLPEGAGFGEIARLVSEAESLTEEAARELQR